MARKSSVERAEQLAGGFATAKKNVMIQFQGRERQQENLMALIRRDILGRGMQDGEIEKVDIYIKPEEQTVFYVVNDTLDGSIPF
ncbi:MAG: DUF6465 family protein [Blautia sp.]|nr:DUF6465 family protein [Blautia sp.]